MTHPPRDFTARRADDATLKAALTQYDLATAELRHRMRAARLARRVRLMLVYATLFAFTVAALVMLDLRLTGHANVFGAALVAAGLWLVGWGLRRG